MMRRLPRLLLALGAGFPPAGVAQSSSAELPFDTLLARRVFAQARELTARDGGALWGRSLGGPLLFVEPKSRAVLSEVPDGEGRLARLGSWYTGLLPASENAANAPIRWAGRSWAMIQWPPPADSLARGVLLAHELWHRMQDSLGLAAGDAPNPHLASLQGRLWLRLEGRALRQALAATGPARTRSLRDALAFRRARRRAFPAAASGEQRLELNEGLAEDSGILLAAPDSAVRRALVADRLLALDTLPHFERSFAYHTGPAYGLFLDAAAPGWRGRLHPDADLAALLAQAIGAPAERPTAVTRGARFGYAAVRRAELARETRQRSHLADLRRRFVSGPALELPLAEMKLGFDPGKVEALDSAGTVYGSLRLSDRWGVLTTDASGGLISPDWRRLIVPAPAEPASGRRLAGPGWVLELAAGWKLAPGRRPQDWTVVGQ